jgi:response regulator of citrate/malate metabolism
MKTTIDKTFDAVKFMREQRDRLSKKLSKMTKEEIVDYFKNKKLENSTKPSA